MISYVKRVFSCRWLHYRPQWTWKSHQTPAVISSWLFFHPWNTCAANLQSGNETLLFPLRSLKRYMRGHWWQWWEKRSKFGLYECVLQPEYKRFHWWSVQPMFIFSLFTFLRTVLQSGIVMIGWALCIRRFRSVYECIKKVLKYEFDDLLLRNVHVSWKFCRIGLSFGIG